MFPLHPSMLLALVVGGLASCTPTPPAALSALGSARLAVHAPEALPADVSRVTVILSGDDMDSRATDLAVSEGGWGGVLGDIPAGAHRTFLVQAFTASNALRYQGRAEDVTIPVGATVLVSLTLQEVAPPPALSNEAPLLDSLVASPSTVAPGARVSLTASAHDPNPGDSVSFAWSAASGGFSTSTQAQTTWTAPAFQGPVTLSLQVGDSRGASATVSLTVNVSAGMGADEVKIRFNTAPRLISLTSSQSALDEGQQTALSVSATDAEGDALGYQWSATCPGTFTGQGSASAAFTPSALPSAACNNCLLSVLVQDGHGGQNTGSLSLCVAPDTRHAPPSIVRGYQSSLKAAAGQQLTFEVEARDPAGSALGFTWAASTGTLGTPSTGATTSRTSWTAPACGSPSITATITNAFALSVTKSFTVTGLPSCLAPGSTPIPGSSDFTPCP